MTSTSPRDRSEAARSLALKAFAAIFVILSLLAIIVLLPVSLIVVGDLFGGSGRPLATEAPDLVVWLVVAWFPAALVIAIRNCVDAVAVYRKPSAVGAFRLAAWSAAALLTCPVLWWAVL